MASAKNVVKPAVWLFYVIIVFEILFMISPFGLYFYSAYGPSLNFLQRWAATAWLTEFFLPHFSHTTSALLNALHIVAGLSIMVGIALFLVAALPLYWAKLRRQGPVIGGLYALIRHPQYLGLAVIGLGTLLVWPRFLVLIAYVTMLFLYTALARWEEERCLARFGDSYRAYQRRTGAFLPKSLSKHIPSILPASGSAKRAAFLGLYVVVIVASLGLAFNVRDYSLSTVSAFYTKDTAVLSPAVLSGQALHAAYRTAIHDARVQHALDVAGAAKMIVYVVPLAWYLPDLPIEVPAMPGAPHEAGDFDRRRYKLLFTRPRTHTPEAIGKEIVETAFGRDPLLLVKIDLATDSVTSIETPPPHVVWGDIPTPMF